jgi:hypothetical protein
MIASMRSGECSKPNETIMSKQTISAVYVEIEALNGHLTPSQIGVMVFGRIFGAYRGTPEHRRWMWQCGGI